MDGDEADTAHPLNPEKFTVKVGRQIRHSMNYSIKKEPLLKQDEWKMQEKHRDRNS